MHTMAFACHFNLEILAMEIADEHIDKMTTSNHFTDEYGETNCAEDDFKVNIKNGWIAVSALNNYVETIVNIILRDCVEYSGERLLYCNIEDKIEFLYCYYKADFFTMKETHYWQSFMKLKKMRNELTHYKNSLVGYSGSSFPTNWGKPFGDIGDYFVLSKMQKTKEHIKCLIRRFATDFCLTVNEEAALFGGSEEDGYLPSIYGIAP
jgi:hypothetical protein